MAKYRLGIIGCGRPWKTPGATGFGMSHRHMWGYKLCPDVELVALADIDLARAKLFQTEHGGKAVYTDYHQMLAKEKPDIVSVCTWPHLHAEMVVAAAEAGAKAIHCEKPMAVTFGDARRMVKVCEERRCQLTFNHQRRFNDPFRKAKDALKSGAIGQLLRMEAQTGNLYDWGTHWFDMLNFLNDDTPAQWVIGQIDTRKHHQIFGVEIEGQGLAHFKFANDVRGLMITGHEAKWGAEIRLCGTEGTIEIAATNDKEVRVWRKGQSDWEVIPTSENIHADPAHAKGIQDLVDALKTGREPELSGRRALRATELIFGTYESSRRRGRVDFPLTIEDSPLYDMLG